MTSFIERCFECLQPFDVELPSQERWGPDAWGHLNLPGHPDIAELTRGQVVISLGSSHPGKHLSHAVVDAAIQAAQQSNRSVVLVGGHAEQTRAEMLAEQHNHVVSRAGQWTLGESALAIQHADAVVSGDTVTMHLAAAVGTPLASVWGCTRPSLGLSAWRPHPQSLDLTPRTITDDPVPNTVPPAATRARQIHFIRTVAPNRFRRTIWPGGCARC